MAFNIDPRASMLAAHQPGLMPGPTQPAAPAPAPAVPADPNTAARAHVISQLAAAASAPSHQNASNAPLGAADRKRAWLDLGLNLMRAGGDWHNGLLSSIGQAGAATLADVDRMQAERAGAAQADQQARTQGLGALLKYYGGERKFAASRADAKAKQKHARDKLAERTAADKARAATEATTAASLADYRHGQIANAQARLSEAAKTGAARRKLLGAQADGASIKAKTAKASGGLKPGQVKLRNGHVATLDDVRQLYNTRFGKFDPISQQYSYGPNTPTLEQFFKQVVQSGTDPFSNPNTAATDPLGLRTGG